MRDCFLLLVPSVPAPRLKILYSISLSILLQVEALSELRNVFGMGRKEAEEATEEVTAKAYKRQLANAVTSGALDKAPSKAEFLSQLCDDLRFDPEQAAAIHAGRGSRMKPVVTATKRHTAEAKAQADYPFAGLASSGSVAPSHLS